MYSFSSAKTLVISFIGMQSQEVAIKPNLNITLKPDTETLEEVIVTAYGTAKKSAFTGSASVIKADEIGKVQTSNATEALTGKVSGVQIRTSSGQPGKNSPSILIRGISSITAGNSPLIILDGTPYEGDLNNINSQDIESMTVLKDAASNALYGARGANGVIMITTKKGTSGKATVTLDAKWGVNTRATQDYKTIDNPAQYYELYYKGLKDYFINEKSYSPSQAHLLANQNLCASNSYGLGYNVYTIPTGQYMIGENGKLNPNATLGNMVNYNGQDYLLIPDNWLDEAYKTSLRQEYNFSVAAGTDKGSFYTSFSYLKNEGISPNSDYSRLTGRVKADYQATKWLKIGVNSSYTHYDSNSLGEDGSSASSGNVFAAATRIAPIYPLYIRDGKGNIMYDKNGLKMYDYGDKTNAGLERPAFTKSNALSDAILNTREGNGNSFSGSVFAEIRFLKDFKFTSTNDVYVDEGRSTTVTNPYYGSYASSNGIVSKTHARIFAYNFQQLLNYTKEIGKHNINVMLGHEYNRYEYYNLNASKSNMFDPNNHELAGAVTDGSQDSYTTLLNREGYFGRVMYDYGGKYFFSASYRRDASSRFHPDNRWGNFWSAGASWLISKEDWFDYSWINMLKLKASYGSQGNDNIGNYRYANVYTIRNSSGNPAAVPETMGNKDITWETNGNFNAGIEFEVFDSRLTGSVEFFYRKTSDMLFSFPLPPTFGYTSYYANIGDMRNRGVELELNGTVVKTNDITWDIRLNMTNYKNKVTYLPEERKTMTMPDGTRGYSSGNYFYGEDIPLYTFYLKKYAGVNENGEALYYIQKKNEDGTYVERETTTKYSDATTYLCGTALPDVYGGFGTTFTYKGFDLSVDFTYQLGGQCYDGDYQSAMNSPTSQGKGNVMHADLLNAWSPENPNSNIPRFQFADSYSAASSDRFLTSASYLTLQNLNLGYTLPSNLCRPMGLEKLRIYLACDNVWTWSKRQGLDPRQSISGSGTASYYAPIRTISGGITVTF